MTHYLLSIYQPDGDGTPPPPEFLEPIMRDVEALKTELREAGAWVFSEVCTRRARPPWCG